MSYDFYNTLFPGTDAICMGRTIYDTKVTGASIDPSYQFFSINALGGKRADSNVLSYRNILIEFDSGGCEYQLGRMADLGAPYTSAVFSGNKSMHFIISLEVPCSNEFEYRSLVERIYTKIQGMDKACGNPSRFSRAPNANRDGVKQDLFELRSRVPNATLEAWLGPAPIVEPIAYYASPGHLSGWTLNFLTFGAPIGEWNNKLFTAVCDMTRNGMSYEEIIGRCTSITGFLDSRDRSTIKSAFQRATKDAK
jgi:hypothetical protein